MARSDSERRCYSASWMWKEAAIEEAPQFRLSRPALPHVHAHRLLRRRRVYGVHQILAHSGQVRIDDPVDDTTAADLIEFVKRHFESFVVEFGHICLLFGREGQSLNPWSGYATAFRAAVLDVTQRKMALPLWKIDVNLPRPRSEICQRGAMENERLPLGPSVHRPDACIPFAWRLGLRCCVRPRDRGRNRRAHGDGSLRGRSRRFTPVRRVIGAQSRPSRGLFCLRRALIASLMVETVSFTKMERP